MTTPQMQQALSAQAEQRLKAERGAIPDEDSVADPDGWPYHDTNGYADDPAAEPPGRVYHRDDVSLADFRIGNREIKCGRCFMVHRTELACEEAW